MKEKNVTHGNSCKNQRNESDYLTIAQGIGIECSFSLPPILRVDTRGRFLLENIKVVEKHLKSSFCCHFQINTIFIPPQMASFFSLVNVPFFPEENQLILYPSTKIYALHSARY